MEEWAVILLFDPYNFVLYVRATLSFNLQLLYYHYQLAFLIHWRSRAFCYQMRFSFMYNF